MIFAAFTRACHSVRFWASSIQFSLSQPIFHYLSWYHSSTRRSPSVFPLEVSKISYTFPTPQPGYISHSSRAPWFNRPKILCEHSKLQSYSLVITSHPFVTSALNQFTSFRVTEQISYSYKTSANIARILTLLLIMKKRAIPECILSLVSSWSSF